MTNETFGEIMAILETVYGKPFADKELRAWWLLIGDLPDDAAKAATVRLCQHSSYNPKPADIIKAVLGDPRDTEQRLEAEAQRAIAHLEQFINDYDYQDFGPFLNAVVRQLGGQDAICRLMMRDEWKFQRPRAIEVYIAYRKRPDQIGEAGRPLMAITLVESMNVSETKWRGMVSKSDWLASLQAQTLQFQSEPMPGLPALPEPARLRALQ